MQAHLTHVALHVRDVEITRRFFARYCGLQEVHRRPSKSAPGDVVWIAEPGREQDFILVLIPGGRSLAQPKDDYSHLGFAAASRSEVDRLAALARAEGCLAWPPQDEAYPVGYYCGIADPDGHVVELSYGQPLGPGAAEFTPDPDAPSAGPEP